MILTKCLCNSVCLKYLQFLSGTYIYGRGRRLAGQEEVIVLPKMQTAPLFTPKTGPRAEGWGRLLHQRGKHGAEGPGGHFGVYKAPAPELSCLFLMRVPRGTGLHHLHVTDAEGGILKDRAPCPEPCGSVRGTGMGDGLWRGAPRKDTAQGWHWGAGPHRIWVHPHRYCCSRPAGWKYTCIIRRQFDSLITRK